MLGLSGTRGRFEKMHKKNSFPQDAASMPKRFYKKYRVRTDQFLGRSVWIIEPKNTKATTQIFYLHGGAFVLNVDKIHWDFMEQLLDKTQCSFVVPDYPLAPRNQADEVVNFVFQCYLNYGSADNSAEKTVVMGDSAGGGLALVLAQSLRNENLTQPDQIVLLTPWLDLSMTHEDIPKIEPFDKVITSKDLLVCARSYGGKLPLDHPQVSPINEKMNGLAPISMFTGTHDILHPDSRKLMQILQQTQVCFNYFEYPKMMHVWMLVKQIKESGTVVQQIVELLEKS